MAFDFGAALSSVGQIAPAMSEGAEIRRQRAADAATVAQQAQAATDTHEARQAQTAREQSLTKLDERNATRLIPLSTKPERGEDGKYYMLFADPATGRPTRLPVEGNYDPANQRGAELDALGIARDSDFGKKYMLGLIKPGNSQPILKQNDKGEFEWIDKPDVFPSMNSPKPADSTSPPPPGVTPTGVKGRMPVGLTPTQTTSSHVYHWVDNQGQVHETPYTTTSRRGPIGAPTPAGATPTAPAPRGTPSLSPSPNSPPLSKGDKIIGTGKLPAASLKVVTTAQPVIDQATKLIGDIDKYGLANNNTSGYLAKDYLYYKAGRAAPAGTLANDIAGLSLGSVVEAAAALSGSSRSIQALKLALVHTPNPWIDSPKLLREKLVTINDRLRDVVNEAKTAGQGSPKDTINNFVKPPAPAQNDPLGIR